MDDEREGLPEQVAKWRALNEQARKLFGKDFADDFADELVRYREALERAQGIAQGPDMGFTHEEEVAAALREVDRILRAALGDEND